MRIREKDQFKTVYDHARGEKWFALSALLITAAAMAAIGAYSGIGHANFYGTLKLVAKPLLAGGLVASLAVALFQARSKERVIPKRVLIEPFLRSYQENLLCFLYDSNNKHFFVDFPTQQKYKFEKVKNHLYYLHVGSKKFVCEPYFGVLGMIGYKLHVENEVFDIDMTRVGYGEMKEELIVEMKEELIVEMKEELIVEMKEEPKPENQEERTLRLFIQQWEAGELTYQKGNQSDYSGSFSGNGGCIAYTFKCEEGLFYLRCEVTKFSVPFRCLSSREFEAMVGEKTFTLSL